jgi:hypothetical protein
LHKNLKMKNLILFTLFFAFFITTNAQGKCEYKINVENEDETTILTENQLVEFLATDSQTAFLYFSLMRKENLKSLVVQLSLSAVNYPPVLCFNSESRITFKLDDGSFVSLRYIGAEDCGRNIEIENNLKNTTSEAAFYLDDVSLKRLNDSPVESLRLTTMKTNFDFVLKNVISNDQITIPIYPKEYFINYLSCVE